MTNNHYQSHDDYRDDLPEYALGILDGRVRAELMEHVETCDDCRATLEALSATADDLLHLAAAADPPVGFETRVLERIAASTRRRPRTRLRVSLAVAASLVLVAGVAVGRWAVPNVPLNHAAGALVQRELTAGGVDVGRVMAYSGRPSWMFVTLSAPNGPASVSCEVVTKSGSRIDLGTFQLAHGDGSWGTPLPESVGSIKTVLLTSPAGRVVARLSSAPWTTPTTSWSE